MADLPEDPVWHEGIYQLEKTDPVSGGAEINPSTKQGISNWPLKQLAERTSWLRKDFEESVVTDPLTVTVGASGDFPDIVAACEELSRQRAGFTNQAGFPAEVKILSGEAIEVQLAVSGVDLAWIMITAEDAVVPIVRAALTIEGGNGFCAFRGEEGARLPILAAQFEMDTSGSATDKIGIRLARGAWGFFDGGGIRNAGHRGAFVSAAATLVARNSDFTGAIENNGLFSDNGGVISANGTNARKGSEDSSSDVRVNKASIIYFEGGTGGTNVTPNEITSSGIIFK